MKYNCLIIDDERPLADSTAEYFNLFGVTAAARYGAGECRAFFKNDSADLILLDINLGDGSGFELCRQLRESINIPILFISARTSDDDKLIALNIGGDDYIQKPYSLSVMLAKVKAVLKRYCAVVNQGNYNDGRLYIDYSRNEVSVSQTKIKLKSLEYKLLCYLIANKGRLISKQELFENVWGDTVTSDGTLNVHIRHLREQIEVDPNNPDYIKTVWGSGYLFEERKI